jgi:tRNA (pseudouridine54-N1)-methyltransferase
VRRFLLLAHRVPVTGSFSLNDLAGAGGRMDEVARSVSTAFTLSNDLRRDTEFTILFVAQPPPAARRIRLYGARLRYLNPDERSTAALLKNALTRSIGRDRDTETSPGLVVGPADPLDALRRFAEEPGTVWAIEDGVPLTSLAISLSSFGVVLSDPDDLTPEEREALARCAIPRASLGPVGLRSSQCIDAIHHFLDRRAAEEASASAPGRVRAMIRTPESPFGGGGLRESPVDEDPPPPR